MNDYKRLVSDTLQWIQESAFFSPVLLATEENALFFSSPKITSAQPKKSLQAPTTVYPTVVQKADTLKEEKKLKPEPIKETSLQKIIEKVHPRFPLTNEIPDDTSAKKKETAGQIAILYFGASPQDLDFLKKLAKAILDSFGPTKLIDARKVAKWDQFLKEGNFKLVISPEKGVQSSFELMKLYTEVPKTQARFLGKTPLLLLASLDQYEKSPHLKRTLWNTVCQILKS